VENKEHKIKSNAKASVLFQNIIKASVKDNPKPKEKKTKAKK
jgi:hypothetical protein